MGSLVLASIPTLSVLVNTCVKCSLPLIMSDTQEFDTLTLRNREVTETLSPLEDLGKNGGKNEEFDKLELRNRTVTEIYSPVDDLGQDAKDKRCNDANKSDKEEFDKLELRNRTVTETLSLVADLGQDANQENEKVNTNEANGENEKDPKVEGVNKKTEEDKDKYDTLELRNRTINEIYSPVEDLGQDVSEKKKEDPKTEDENKTNEDDTNEYDTLELRNRTVNEVFEPVDTLELRNRTVNEIFSPVSDLGQDNPDEPSAKKQKF